MTSAETVNLRQKAVLWARTGYDGNGDPVVGAPTEINVRWEKGLTQQSGPEEAPVSHNITVYVDRVITIGSHLRLGALADLPSPLDEIHEVVDFKETPDIKARKYQRTVLLIRK